MRQILDIALHTACSKIRTDVPIFTHWHILVFHLL